MSIICTAFGQRLKYGQHLVRAFGYANHGKALATLLQEGSL